MNEDVSQDQSPVVSVDVEVEPKDAKWSEGLGLALRGSLMGAADIIPGVSGGTMALILGIYLRLINAIKSVSTDVVKDIVSFNLKSALERIHYRFLICLLAGVGSGMIICTKVFKIPELLKTHPQEIYGLFFGLILGSIILLAKESGKPKGAAGYLCYLAGGLFGWAVIVLLKGTTPETPFFVFICGMIAICAMILPGISGSYILLVLKKYEYVLGGVFFANDQPALTNILTIILPFCVGAVLGISLFSRVLSWVFRRWERQTMMAMNGLLIVSMYVIFPFQHKKTILVTVKEHTKEKIINVGARIPSMDELFASSGCMAMGLAVTGFVLVLAMDYFAKRKNSDAIGQ